MNFLIVFACVVSLSIASSGEETEWLQFKRSHGKLYKSPQEEKTRFDIFKENLRKIREHNTRYVNEEETYFLKVTQFADLTLDEFKQYLHAKPPSNVTFTPRPKVAVPDSIDWRQNNIFTGIKNQGACGSCYAFSSMAIIESHHALKHGNVISLSEQNIVDCTNGVGGNNGCVGGHDYVGIDLVVNTGVEYEDDYPYEANVGNCRFDASKKAAVSVSGYSYLEQGEAPLKEAVGSIGPVSVMINADAMQSYGGGILNDPSCSSNVDHFVVAVGYGSENGIDYWINRNSWGTGWGEDGYFRMIRNANNQCGYGIWSVIPNVN